VRAEKDPLIGTGNADTEGSVLAARLVRTASTCWTRFSLWTAFVQVLVQTMDSYDT